MTAVAQSEPLRITVRAAAKINLCLGVGPARDDGFHALDTVYQAVSLYDDVTVAEASQWSLVVESVGGVDVAGVPTDETNLAIRAGKLLAEHHGLSGATAEIRIAKGIPVAGGMAGGSADAAAALVALDRLWDLGTPDQELLALAARLGSDVPFALIGGTARGSGRGEIVDPVEDLASWWWVVVPHGIGLSTPEVFRRFDEFGTGPTRPKILSESLLAALATGEPLTLAKAVANDLEPPAFDLRPDLADTAEALAKADALTTLLSGSGPTMLGLAENQQHAHLIRERMMESGYAAWVATGPVAGCHLVEIA